MRIDRLANLGGLIERTRCLLLDFDGPICSVFAGLPAPTVADQLRQLLHADGSASGQAADADDPLEVLRFTATLGPAAAERVEAALRAFELAATRTAEPTPHAREVLLACEQTRRPVAIISNNAQSAVESYLAAHDLTRHVAVIVGRTRSDPTLLKPSPHLVKQALDALDSAPGSCALVGDSVSDIESAKAAGTRSVGYANRPGKDSKLDQAGADAIATTLAELETALLAGRPSP